MKVFCRGRRVYVPKGEPNYLSSGRGVKRLVAQHIRSPDGKEGLPAHFPVEWRNLHSKHFQITSGSLIITLLPDLIDLGFTIWDSASADERGEIYAPFWWLYPGIPIPPNNSDFFLDADEEGASQDPEGISLFFSAT